MTSDEYNRLYARARRRAGVLTRRAMVEIKTAYLEAADNVAAVVRDAQKRGLSAFTAGSQAAIEDQLREGARIIQGQLDEVVPNTIRNTSANVSGVDTEYLVQAAEGTGLSATAIRNIGTRINEQLVRIVNQRIWEDGVTFSQRVWEAGKDFQTQSKRVLSIGLSEGRDAVLIAEDLQQYVADGKKRLVQRYGPDLQPGSRALLRRVRRNIDYRALRLVRSEQYAALQEAGRLSGRMNPAALDLYDFVLEPTRQHWNCACPDLAAGGPYKFTDVPGYPHPNCRCRVQARLMDGAQFNQDIRAWAQGQPIPYIQDWFDNYYNSPLTP